MLIALIILGVYSLFTTIIIVFFGIFSYVWHKKEKRYLTRLQNQKKMLELTAITNYKIYMNHALSFKGNK